MASSNFVLPIKTLVSDDGEIELEPWNSHIHLNPYWTGTGPSIDLYKYVPFGPYPTLDDLASGFIKTMIEDPTRQLYAILTTRRTTTTPSPLPLPLPPPPLPSSSSLPSTTTSSSPPILPKPLAGIIGYVHTTLPNLTTEIGPIIILPGYQGHGFGRSAVELLSRHALTSPKLGGLGLLRVVYTANVENQGSVKLAEKAGFRREGVARWFMVVEEGVERGKVGNGRGVPAWVDDNDGDEGDGEIEEKRRMIKGAVCRDSVVLSRCWDDLT